MTLSIVTINYNNLEGLRKTIDSVLSQTWHDFEWIIIDGGSTDGSKELIEETAKQLASSDFNPLSYWCSEPDKGIYNAMNKGISHCKGEYINCMNSGDYFYNSDVLAKVFSEKLYGEIIYGNWYQQYANEQKFKEFPIYQIHYRFPYENICHQAIFCKTNILKEKNFEENILHADWKRWTEELLSGKTFQHIPITVCIYDMYGLTGTKSKETFLQEHNLILSLYANQISLYHENFYIYNCIHILKENWLYSSILRITIKILSKFIKFQNILKQHII